MPTTWGGSEVDILSQIEIVEAVSRAYGSAGWCAMIGSDGGFYSASLDDRTGRELYPYLDAITAGWLYPVGRLKIVDGGFLLSGRWSFGSGCTHADVIVGGAAVFDGGQMVLRTDGKPEWRVALLPAAQFEVLDTWYTTGLAGSGSHDYTIDGAFVPIERTFRFGEVKRPGALYAWPGLFFANIPGVPLGIARDALDAATVTLADKFILPERKLARDEPRVRLAIARAHALINSARSYVFDVLGQFWATLQAGDIPTAVLSCVGFLYIRRERPERRKSCVADKETLRLSSSPVRASRGCSHTHFWQRLVLDDSARAGCPSQARHSSGKE